jgi:hypothetical protein
VTRALVFAAVVGVLVATAVSAGAETYQFRAPDGSVHYTNAPGDPRYQRMAALSGTFSGTSEGWLQVPATVSTPSLTEMIRVAAQRHGIPEQIVSAVIRVESGFNARAVSRKGARGLMQLMPQTAAVLGVRDSFDPMENINGGVRHLRGLMERFGNNLPLALAAYNAGEGAVNTYGGIPPYPETQAYVGRILSMLGGSAAATVTSSSTYRYVANDGAVVYTNIPPHGSPSPRR